MCWIILEHGDDEADEDDDEDDDLKREETVQ